MSFESSFREKKREREKKIRSDWSSGPARLIVMPVGGDKCLHVRLWITEVIKSTIHPIRFSTATAQRLQIKNTETIYRRFFHSWRSTFSTLILSNALHGFYQAIKNNNGSSSLNKPSFTLPHTRGTRLPVHSNALRNASFIFKTLTRSVKGVFVQ